MNLIISILLFLLLSSCSACWKVTVKDYSLTIGAQIEIKEEFDEASNA